MHPIDFNDDDDSPLLWIRLAIAALVLAIGGVGFWKRNWILSETPKGRFLVAAIGTAQARMLVAGFFLILVGVGVLLAGGWLAPIRW